jgi:hypothetical protein
MSADPIAEVFAKHLPSLPAETAEAFAKGMRSYHTEFKRYRDIAMDYESLEEYKSEQHTIMQVEQGQFWPYSPHFMKSMALVIQDLFKTKITGLSTSPVAMEPTIVFLDENKNRWVVLVERCALNPAMNKIQIQFPRSKTPVSTIGNAISSKQLSDPAFCLSGLALYAHSVTEWSSTLR